MPAINLPTKSTIIYEELKRAIARGRYKTQEKIILSEAAKEFGTNASPVREAMKKLESEGLMVITPRKSAVVTEINL